MRDNYQLTSDELAAMQAFRVAHGRTWKDALREAWMNDYASQRGTLRRVRNCVDSFADAFAQCERAYPDPAQEAKRAAQEAKRAAKSKAKTAAPVATMTAGALDARSPYPFG